MVGEAVGREAAAEKVSVLLGPGLNIIRSPLGGRNFEYYSEDPYLSGELAKSMVFGIQSNGVAACLKHFAVNSQEHMRMSTDEVVDERAFREIYLEAFKKAVLESKPEVVMSAYNKVNGVYANENTHLLQDILYDEWQFKGVVVTDWGGNNDRVEGLKAGNQLEMPSTNGITDAQIVSAVKDGQIEQSLLDTRVDQLLHLIFMAHHILQTDVKVDYKEQHKKAVKAARQSIVLLKNDDNILPLNPKSSVGIIGDFAFTPRYQGAGSSLVNPTMMTSAYDCLIKEHIEIPGASRGFKRFGGRSRRLSAEAINIARHSETILLFLGLDESIEAEGIDRPHMRLAQNQLDLVDSILQVNKNVVVILSGGAPVELPFANKVQAIVNLSLSGQGGGQAIADVLMGRYNPSGKLAVTYPKEYKDSPSSEYYPGEELSAEHRESIYVGYRYYETKDIAVRFPFGHGLSYTDFQYSNLKVSKSKIEFEITNMGSVEGEEVAQVYIKPIDSKIFRAAKELKGFDKVKLQSGETKKLSITLDENAFSYYNIEAKQWVEESIEYEIEVGASIEDIRLSDKLRISALKFADPYRSKDIPSYRSADIKNVSRREFERLYGGKLPAHHWDRGVKLTLNDTVSQLKYKNWFGRSIYGLMLFARKVLLIFRQPIKANNIMFVVNLPFKNIEKLTGGKIKQKLVEGFLKLINL